MPCIPVLHHYPQCPASPYCIITHNALHHYPRGCEHGFLFPPRCGGFPTPPALGLHRTLGPPQRWGGCDHGEQLLLQRFSWLFLCLLFSPGPWASLVCRQVMCLQRQEMLSHLKVHPSLKHNCSNHFGDSIKIVTDFLLSCYLNSTRSVLTYTPGQCSLPQRSCEDPSGPSSQMGSISFFFFFFFYEIHWNRTFAPWIPFHYRAYLSFLSLLEQIAKLFKA